MGTSNVDVEVHCHARREFFQQPMGLAAEVANRPCDERNEGQPTVRFGSGQAAVAPVLPDLVSRRIRSVLVRDGDIYSLDRLATREEKVHSGLWIS